MGEKGTDIKLSPSAKKLIPYAFECKNTEKKFTSVFTAYKQAQSNAGTLEFPALLIKQNQAKPLIIISAEHFFDLIKES